MLFGSGIRKSPFGTGKKHTVDGRNPAPVDMVNIPLFKGFVGDHQALAFEFGSRKLTIPRHQQNCQIMHRNGDFQPFPM